jgi:hypothetical protein
MALLAQVGKLDVPASTGNQVITGLGFQPKALLFWYTMRTDDGVSGGLGVGFGGATSSTDLFSVASNGDDNVGTANVSDGNTKVRCIIVPTSAGSGRSLQASLVSLDADGFTLNWGIVSSGVDVHYLALAGSALTGAKAGEFTKRTSNGNQSVTGIGFQPSVVLLFPSRRTNSDGQTGDAHLNVGVATSSTNRWAITQGSNDAAATGDAARAMYTDHVMTTLNDSITGAFMQADFVSMDADGFTLNENPAGGNLEWVGYLALGGVAADVGTITIPASTGNQVTSGIGFQPSALILAGANLDSASLGALQNDWNLSFGAASATTARSAIWTGDMDGADPTITKMASRTDLIYAAYSLATSPAISSSADLVSFDASGWTLNWAAVGGSHVVGYLALGPAFDYQEGAASLSGTGTATPDGSVIRGGAASLGGTGTLSGDGSAIMAAVAALSGTGTLSALGGFLLDGAASLSGTGSLAADGSRVVQATATLDATGTLSAAANLILGGSISLSATGDLAASASLIVGAAANLTGTSNAVLDATVQLGKRLIKGMIRAAQLPPLAAIRAAVASPVAAVRDGVDPPTVLIRSAPPVPVAVVRDAHPDPLGVTRGALSTPLGVVRESR